MTDEQLDKTLEDKVIRGTHYHKVSLYHNFYPYFPNL